MTDIATTFNARLADDLRAEAEALDGLADRLENLRARGEAAWPALVLEEEAFVEALARALRAATPKEGLGQWLDHVQAEDLHLAVACGAGRPGAIAAFEERYRADLGRMVRKYAGAELPEEDLLQQLRERLFVSTPTRAAKILSYSGQGLLQNWLRVTGARLFIDVLRAASRRQDKAMLSGGADGILEVPDALQDMELDFLKREYRGKFKESFAVAARTLTPGERNLLRQHLIHRLTVEQLGRLEGVHGATISRRIGKAREALLEATRREFMARLQVDTAEYDSIMVMIRSKLDLSMPRLLESSIVSEDSEEG